MTEHSGERGIDGAEVEYRYHVTNLLRKVVDDDLIVLNDDGYLVVPDPEGSVMGTRCIELTGGELAVLRASLSGRSNP